jgi:hypothetical protein
MRVEENAPPAPMLKEREIMMLRRNPADNAHEPPVHLADNASANGNTHLASAYLSQDFALRRAATHEKVLQASCTGACLKTSLQAAPELA